MTLIDIFSPQSDFRAIGALWYFGAWPFERLAEIAVEALGRGFDSEAIRRMANLTDAMEPKTQSIVSQAFADMGFPPMNQEQAGMALARMIAEKIISGNLDPLEGCQLIWWRISNVIGRPGPLMVFVGISSEAGDHPMANQDEYRDEAVKAARALLQT